MEIVFAFLVGVIGGVLAGAYIAVRAYEKNDGEKKPGA